MTTRSLFTTVTPLPHGLSREAAVAFLHDHVQMIDLNPLVRERHRMSSAPAHASAEELSCVWYALTDRIMGRDVRYTCAFHDLARGLQTHSYAPLGVQTRSKWTVAGCLPGETREPVELGLGAPSTGLYIREDVDLRCNVLMAAFVKKTIKKSHGVLVDKLAALASGGNHPPPPPSSRMSMPASSSPYHSQHLQDLHMDRSPPPPASRHYSQQLQNLHMDRPLPPTPPPQELDDDDARLIK
ncbi:hypothetical protein AAL_01508 [Moelleriella libera RCEF 2490]|uniref:DUF7053 domain-containing protein n=1 Tax=Moelleriella libera RCEF 2490 TaxID=1081109 RepID=A0A162K2I6_9HYPO|nr:hypothetical protein AAL_01508 [Moelleriella libera RCEF 2490]